jgi:hypothetical protein
MDVTPCGFGVVDDGLTDDAQRARCALTICFDNNQVRTRGQILGCNGDSMSDLTGW